MSNALAIAAVTKTLQHLLTNGVSDFPGQVVAKAPDKAQVSTDQINVFLYHMPLNASWRNMDMPRQVRPGETGLPSLSLNLCYMITAYGNNDDESLSQQWLGKAISVLFDHPVLGAEEIKNALAGSGLEDQVERVRLTSLNLPSDEMSKLWTAFQAPYRNSMAYQADVVLIESTRAGTTPLPVLTRGANDRGPSATAGNSLPIITSVLLPNEQSSAFLGDQLTIVGQNLGDLAAVRFTLISSQTPSVAPISLPPAATQVTQDGVTVNVPDDAAARILWAAGFYTVAVVVNRTVDGSAQMWSSNELPLSIAPRIQQITPANPHPDVNGKVTLTVTCQPEIKLALVDATHTRFAQRVVLLLGTSRQIAPEPPPAPPATTTGTVEFIFPVAPAELEEYLVRLRVDGVDLPIVDRTVTPPVFAASQKVTIS